MTLWIEKLKKTLTTNILIFFSNWANPPELLPGSWDLHDLIKGILEKKSKILNQTNIEGWNWEKNINKKTLQNKKK
jgi:hypothetical protein